MKRLFVAVLAALALIAAFGSSAVQAHGLASGQASGGLAAGLAHPVLGLDHLVLLLAVGAAGAAISAQLLLWALGGAGVGALIGSSGASLPAAEVLAALAISAVGLLILASGRPHGGLGFLRRGMAQSNRLPGVLVACCLALHGMLHGLEAPQDGSAWLWWGGALLASVLVTGSSFLIVQRLGLRWSRGLALAAVVAGVGAVF